MNSARAHRRAMGAGGEAEWLVERVTVHGKHLEGSLEGDSADYDVAVCWPASYRAAGAAVSGSVPAAPLHRRCRPLVGVKQHFMNVPAVGDEALGAGTQEAILVMPNAFMRYQGSMYSNRGYVLD